MPSRRSGYREDWDHKGYVMRFALEIAFFALAITAVAFLLMLHDHRCGSGEAWSIDSHMCVLICPATGCT